MACRAGLLNRATRQRSCGFESHTFRFAFRSVGIGQPCSVDGVRGVTVGMRPCEGRGDEFDSRRTPYS